MMGKVSTTSECCLSLIAGFNLTKGKLATIIVVVILIIVAIAAALTYNSMIGKQQDLGEN